MKFLFVTILALLLSSQVWALGGNGFIPRPIMVSAGDEHTCVLDVGGVNCWGSNYYGQLNVPLLKYPTQVSAGDEHTCALDAEGVKCWGSNDFGQTNVPRLKSPTQIVVGNSFSCALDLEGVKCWGNNSYGQIYVPVLKSPIQVSAGGNHTCALDLEGVKCWGFNYDGQTNVPVLKSPVQVSAGGRHTCALDIEGVKCWGLNDKGQTKVPALKSPTQVSAGPSHTCALDAEGVKCWGENDEGQTDVPTLISPIQVSAGWLYTCALDAEGVKCWGQNDKGQINVPEVLFDLLSDAIPILSASRAQYLKGTSEFKSQAYYLACLIASPAILSVDSSYFVESFIPRFKKLIQLQQKQLGYKGNIQDVPDAEEHRKLAIVSLQSALSVSISYISQDQQTSLQDSLRAAGVALSEPMNNHKIKDLLTQIDALSAEKQKLKSSPKSAFLVDSLELAANWLREKVK